MTKTLYKLTKEPVANGFPRPTLEKLTDVVTSPTRAVQPLFFCHLQFLILTSPSMVDVVSPSLHNMEGKSTYQEADVGGGGSFQLCNGIRPREPGEKCHAARAMDA